MAAPRQGFGVLWGMEGSGHQGGHPGGRAPLTSWPRCPTQSYCLKVKEMDDEEYSCIVSFQGQLGGGPGGGKSGGAHSFPCLSHRGPRMSWGCQGQRVAQANLGEAWGSGWALVSGGVGLSIPTQAPLGPRVPAGLLRGRSPRLCEALVGRS